jgi:hypothetical protein
MKDYTKRDDATCRYGFCGAYGGDDDYADYYYHLADYDFNDDRDDRLCECDDNRN